jgi:5-formyltetrahydrofolate cyclo-ligase
MSSAEEPELKRTLRQQMLQKLTQISEIKKATASQKIITKLLQLPELAQVKKIGVFEPFKTEPNLDEFYKQLEKKGVQLIFPPDLWTENPDLILVPGLAFTLAGERLGRGHGFYDKLLLKFSNVLSIGICFAEQIVDELPVEAHDQKVDLVISGN